MLSQMQAVAKRGLRLSFDGIRIGSVWGTALLVLSMLFKLEWLDHQLDVGGMNHWKWMVNAGAMLIATCWLALLGPRARAIGITVLDLALTFVIFSDLIYFRYFKDFISIPVLLQAGQVSSLQDSIWSLIYPGDWWLFADIPVAIALTITLLWWMRKNSKASLYYRSKPRKKLWLKGAPALVVLAAGIILISYPVQVQKNGWASGLFVGNWWNVPIYNVTGLFGFHGYDSYRYAKEHWFGEGISKADYEDAKNWFDDRKKLQEQMESEPLYGKYEGKNIILVQAEAFQTFVIGQALGGQEITPNLNRLISQSVYFPNFYHQTGQGRTSDADFITSCSLHPLPTGSVFIRFAGNEFDCLPSILNEESYDTTVHHAYDGSFWNRNNMYHNMEYAQFYSVKDYTIDEPIGWSLGDKSFFRQTVQQIKERGEKPFYTFAISLSSHHPFKLPYSSTKFNVGEFTGTTFGYYLQAAHYVDEAIGDLIEDLKQNGLWDDTILMFYGDHDNSLYDMKPYEKLLGRSMTDLEKAEAVRRVPFFIHLPGDDQAGTTIDKAVGQQDTAPTILHLLGIPVKDKYMMGISMLSKAEKPVIFRNGEYTDGKVYYIPGSDGLPEHGECLSVPASEKLEPAICKAGAEAAKKTLEVSDRVVENDLIARFRKDDAEKR